eukprot:1424435-Prymnesium_polylepis.1
MLGARTQSGDAIGDAVKLSGAVVLEREERRSERLVRREIQQRVEIVHFDGLLPRNAPVGQMRQTPSELRIHDPRPARAVRLIVLVPRRGGALGLDDGAALARTLPVVGGHARVGIAAAKKLEQEWEEEAQRGQAACACRH